MTDWRGEVGIQPWLEELAAKSRWVQDIAEQVAKQYGVTVADIKGDSRARTHSFPRQEFFYLAMVETRLASTAIGRWCGRRDHATVLAGAIAHARRHGLPKARTGNFNKG